MAAATAVLAAAAGLTAAAAPAHAADCTTAQLISNGGFEDGTSPWTTTSGVVSSSGSGESAHTGTHFAWFDGYGSSHTDSATQSVTLPAGCKATLSFYLHIDTDENTSTTAYDTFTAKVGGDTVASFSNLDAGSGYVKKSFDASAYAGKTVTLSFSGTEDSGLQTSFVLDDAALDISGTTTPPPPPPPPGDGNRTPGSQKYTVNLTSDSSGGNWQGHESVGFTNTSSAPLSEVYLRLWDNAHGNCPSSTPITVGNVTGGTASGLSVGCTAMKVTLPGPLNQGESATIAFDLGIVVPSGADRFGHDGPYNFLGNALPVLTVHDGDGWHLDPYTNNGESFYQLASDYKVTLDHPDSLEVPSTGTAVDTPGSSGRTITTATAANVREFAWGAGPFSKISGTSPKGVKVNMYWVDGIGSSSAQQMLTLAESAIDAHSGRFGDYPYGEVDAILDNNFWFGGMEYPGFILDLVSNVALPHELAHQWWYGIVGDDEYGHPWLDEAFADYATDLYRGVDGTGCWNNVSWASSAEKISNPMAYWDQHSSRYSTVVYGYGKCALHDLRRLIGDSAMNGLLKTYAKDHWYGISTTSEFKEAAQAATSIDLTAFWAQHRIDG
ncbi:M1 family peptidase [Actinomadura latina]|uniref:M1 family peptidase n=2 Tax=Actinomadura latina TaxID=163603 RepID=A0A846Z3A7_9ACTN|nr:M1 family peptidase [Actinomadura latina]